MVSRPFLDVSRRGLLGGVAATFVVAPAISPLCAQTLMADPPPDATNEAASLAARNEEADRMTVEVRVNGTGPYHFIVDTGAEQSVISDTLARALNLPAGRPVVVSGLTGLMPAQSAMASELAFGPFTRKNLTMPVLSRAALHVDGYLGLDVLAESRVTFDFAHRAIRIDRSASRGTLRGRDTTQVRALGSSGRLRVTNCLVDGVRATAFIDTGAEVSVGNLALREAMVKRRRGLPDLGKLILNGVTGGELTGNVVPIKRIVLQSLNFTDSTVVIADVPSFNAWNLENKPALLIGMNFLRQFAAMSIDYRAQEFRFELSSAPPNPQPGVAIV